MKYAIAAELLLASGALALPEIAIVKRDRHTHGKTAHVARGMVKRQGTLETTLFSGVGYVGGGAYYANITVGTPAQLQTVLIDTGSSDLYFDSRTAPACQNSGPHQCEGNTFNPASSSSYNVLFPSPAFNASYGDGSTAIGPFAEDTVCINNICIENTQFGLAQDVHSTVGPAIGLMGVGYSRIEASKREYPNIVETLSGAGIINSRLYSLYLNDYADITGSILFGGLDTDKYTGSLVTVNIIPSILTSSVIQFITAATGLKTSVGGKTSTIFSGGRGGAASYKTNSGSLPVLLDSGSSAWSVPPNVYQAIVNQFTYIDARSGAAKCSYAQSGDSITVTFENAININVDIKEFLLPIFDPSTGKPVPWDSNNPNGEQACGFGIIPSQGTGQGFDTMGDAVMRSMYIVYDLDNGQMSLAQSKQGSTSSNVKVVQAGPGGVAKAAGIQLKGTANAYSIAPTVSVSASYVVSTAKTAVGTLTGAAAVPTQGRVDSSSSGGGSGGGSGSGANAVVSSWGGLLATGFAAVVAVVAAGFML